MRYITYVLIVVFLAGCGGTARLVKEVESQTETVKEEAKAIHKAVTEHRVACEVRQESEAVAEAKTIETMTGPHIESIETMTTGIGAVLAAKDAEIAELEEQAAPAAKWRFITVIGVPLLALGAAVYLDFRLKLRWLSAIVLSLGIVMGAGLAWAFYKSFIIAGGIVLVVVGLAFAVVSILTKQQWFTEQVVKAVQKGREKLKLTKHSGEVKQKDPIDLFDDEVGKKMDAEVVAEVRKIKDS